MIGFQVRFETKQQFLEGLNNLKEIGALGECLNVGSDFDDYFTVNEDVLNGEIELFDKFPPEDINRFIEFRIGFELNEHVKEYPHLFGKNNICVSLSTYHDCVLGKTTYDKKVPYNGMIPETLGLMAMEIQLSIIN